MQINKKNMIESQLKPEGISCQSTLNCIEKVNREDFVPIEYKKLAYAEYDIPLKNNFNMLRPLMVAKILQLLEIHSNCNILEIGTGSGYLTCCLSMIGKTVDTVDIDKSMLDAAKKIHDKYNIYNINYLHKDVFSNWVPEKKYDIIVITGAVESRLEKLEQILNQKGKMFIVIGNYPVMNVNIIEKVSENKLICDQSFETVIDHLINNNKKNILNF
tara:strand:+ start:2376 stop:3023 length:648 start_codon:yes stop_codon:yes gene_type:complete